MVTWTGDGTLVGYDPTTGRLQKNTYKFASPGTVNVNAITRLQYPLGSTAYPLSAADKEAYPNRVEITAPLQWATADFTNNPGKQLGIALYITLDTDFPPGTVPTPAQIIASPSVAVVKGSSYGPAQPGNWSSTLGASFSPGVPPNNRYWVLALPAAWDFNGPNNTTNIKPLKNSNVNTLGRAMSMVGNRTPRAPKIVTPAPNTLVDAGTTFVLEYLPDDLDGTTPVDSNKRALDLAGVQVQYAAPATPSNPTPVWNDLPFYLADGSPSTAFYIRGSKYEDEADGKAAIVNNLKVPIICGSGARPPLTGALPGGSWQLRVRTFDYGHPYPGVFSALGAAKLGQPGVVEPATYPASNTSPWSTPVTVQVPVQVPPPIPLSPTGGLAVEANLPTRLSWKYRNTFTPPFAQRRRWVQIREVGSALWRTVTAGLGSDPFYDLPVTTTAVPALAPSQRQADFGFESGTLGGWSVENSFFGGTGTATMVNLNDSAQAFAGNRSLRASITGGNGWPRMSKLYTLAAGHDTAEFSICVKPPGSTTDIVQVGVYWADSGEPVEEWQVFTLNKPSGGWGTGYLELGTESHTIPPGMTGVYVAVGVGSNTADTLNGLHIDNVSLISSSSTAVDDFTLESGKNYEWRVEVEDTDLVRSGYGPSANFWAVPAAGSGGVRPVPTETVEGATLGCGQYSVFVYRRGGKRRVGQIKGITSLDWGRMRDDISTAKVVVEDWDIDCGNLLSTLRCWAYELVIFRDNGFSTDRVWEGPLTLLTYEHDSVTLHAKDVMGYAYRRILKQAMSDSGKGNGKTVVDRARRILQNVFGPDDPNVLPYLTPLAQADDAMQYRSTPAYSRTAFEEVDDMASNSGLDYTVVGRAILLWGTKHRIGTLPEMRDEDLGNRPIVSEYGMSMANRYAISDGNGVWGEATRLDVSGNDPDYGLVEMLSSSWASDSENESGTYTEAGLATVIKSFEGYAERSIADRYMPGAPVVVRIPDNTTLNPTVVLSIQHLVPGVVIPLRSKGTLRTVVGNQKLDSVKVQVKGGEETISITVSPFSRDDNMGGEGGGEE